MEFVSTQKYLIHSTRKLREVARVVKKIPPQKALDLLPFIGKKAALPISKVIKAALASAKEKGVSQDDLVFKEIQIGEGPRLKRGRPVSRGRWHPYVRRMSHIRVVLKQAKLAESRTKKEGSLSVKGEKRGSKD